MALSLFLEQHGRAPEAIRTTATVHLDQQQLAITRIELRTEAEVPGLDESEFRNLAEQAKQNCPVSKALGGVQIVLASATVSPFTSPTTLKANSGFWPPRRRDASSGDIVNDGCAL